MASLASECDRVSEVIFALGVFLADFLDDRERHVSTQGHQTAIAQGNGPFFLGRILVLPDIEQLVARHDETAVARGITGVESERHDRCSSP